MELHQSEAEQQKIRQTLSPNKVILPVIISLAIAGFFFYTSVDIDEVKTNFSKASGLWIAAAVLVLVIRDAGYIYRIRHVTQKALSWSSSVYTILLWEFSSAVTPSAVGGTAIAVFILNREGIKFGKSLAYVMVTALLDNSFFLIAAPLAIVFSQGTVFPDESQLGNFGFLSTGLKLTFWISYSLILIYNVFFAVGLLLKPEAFKWFLIKVTSIPFLKRWKKGAEESGDEVILASAELRGIGGGYWWKAGLSTLFVWTARYAMVNCLLEAFSAISISGHWLIFARHILMWIIMLISPTPGSSGTAEITFEIFFKEFIGTFSAAVALFWRLFTYYPYLFAGAIVLPRWYVKTAKNNQIDHKEENDLKKE
jgi:glycosyltransferase 2 family protein